jgi:cytochrome c oxidase cbb3-type subunit III
MRFSRMRTVILTAALGLVAAVSVATCGGGGMTHNDMAPAGALPGLRATVGPIPGPKPPGGPAAIVNPYANDVVARQDGRRLFVEMNCYGCHGGHAGGGMGPSLRDKTWIYGQSDADIFDSIASGRANGMPAWGTKLSDQQIWELVAYVQTLESPNEVEPPTPPAIPNQVGQ